MASVELRMDDRSGRRRIGSTEKKPLVDWTRARGILGSESEGGASYSMK